LDQELLRKTGTTATLDSTATAGARVGDHAREVAILFGGGWRMPSGYFDQGAVHGGWIRRWVPDLLTEDTAHADLSLTKFYPGLELIFNFDATHQYKLLVRDPKASQDDFDLRGTLDLRWRFNFK
jgi:hypothetical protein